MRKIFSFIVIGKNEGWKLSLCFESIVNSIKTNRIECYEILYIDAQSSDNSLSIAQKYPDIKTFVITGKCNAAIARNIGGIESQGDILIFLDGDMELQADFIPCLFERSGELIHPFISGINSHWFYNNRWELISVKNLPKIQDNVFEKTTGGFFIITKILWVTVGGMDSRLQANEDLDFGLSLSKVMFFPLRIAKVGVIHHTLESLDSNRIWKKMLLYRFPALLVRKHLFTNRHYAYMFLRMNYSVVLLLLTLATFSPFVLAVYLLVVMVRSIKRKVSKVYRVFPYFISRDLLFLISLFFFFPSTPKIEYK